MLDSIAIDPVDVQEFDQFLVYLNDHLSDNGKEGAAYFQPQPQSESFLPPASRDSFIAGLVVPVGQPSWRRLWVARNPEGQIVGHIDLRARREPFSGHRCLLGMGVDRDHRRVGLGKRLLEHAQGWASASELLEWMDLQVLAVNQKAIRLYERMGFIKTGEITDMFRIDGQCFSHIDMTKNIGRLSAADAERAD